MELSEAWEVFGKNAPFTFYSLPAQLQQKGQYMELDANQVVVHQGEFPEYIYFVLDGAIAGVREQDKESEYNYFRLEANNGGIGVLELLAGEKNYMATMVSLTKVRLAKVPAVSVYIEIMSDFSMLRQCTTVLAKSLYKRFGSENTLHDLRGLDRVRYYLFTYYETYYPTPEKGTLLIQEQYQDIADKIGMSVRTVGRNLQKLRELGEISSYRRNICMTEQQYEQMKQKICKK